MFFSVEVYLERMNEISGTFLSECIWQLCLRAMAPHDGLMWYNHIPGFSELGFPGSSEGKASACDAGDLGSIPGSESSPGEGHGNPLQYSCLENPTDGGA